MNASNVKFEMSQAGHYKIKGNTALEDIRISRDTYKSHSSTGTLWVVEWLGDYMTANTLKEAKKIATQQYLTNF